ncbi:MAG: DNA mismatch repair endonuclease MutL [Bacteroidales bacterium]|nr:DNA mismatch repair endonuclease MutL [Bacteroidales bacterium]
MENRIRLLSPDLASQIAAGEVIQRPASVVKELIENALDAQASNIFINVEEAGKKAILVDDDGIGMNPVDAVLAFEKHATSKISNVHDLFNIVTYGFRGEALPSIASISRVELKTRDEFNEIGTYLYLEANKIIEQKPYPRDRGTTILVKDLFYNIPARKKFLKSDHLELMHIYEEIYRAALSNLNVQFNFHVNEKPVLNLPPQQLIHRILAIFGKSYQNKLIYFEEYTDDVSFYGYVLKPEFCKKTRGEQYLFVNHRFFRSPLLHRAIKKAYETLIPIDVVPGYIIFFNIHPSFIDVNIHPTKTEVKFTHEQVIASFLTSAIKKAISSSHLIPSMDFDIDRSIQFPVFNEKSSSSTQNYSLPTNDDIKTYNVHSRLADYYFTTPAEERKDSDLFSNSDQISTLFEQSFAQYKKKYIITSIKAGLMIIHQHRAHVRILYEQFLKSSAAASSAHAQPLLFPITLEVTPQNQWLIREMQSELRRLGFEIQENDNIFSIHAVPSYLNYPDLQLPIIIDELLASFQEIGKAEINRNIPFLLAKNIAIKEGKILTNEEMETLIHQLFLTSEPQITPDGKTIYVILPESYIEELFKSSHNL